MHLITVIEHSDEWSDLWIQKAFIFELLLLAVSYPLIFLCIYLLIYTKQYHPNLSILMKHLFIQYPFQMVARIVLVVKMMTETTENLKEDVVFIVACCIRSYLIFIAFYFSLFAMTERSFATYYLKDYESRQRKSIGYSLTFLLHAVSYLAGSLFIFGIISVWPILSSFIVCNIAAFVMCHMNSFLNEKKLQAVIFSKTSASQYSLSERYQLAENIAVATLFKKGIVLFIFFSLFCCSFLSAEEIDDDVSLRNWMYVSFNLSCACYGLIVPLFLFYYNEEWIQATKRLWAKVSCHHISSTGYPRRQSNLVVSAQKTTELYFSQLAKDWSPS